MPETTDTAVPAPPRPKKRRVPTALRAFWVLFVAGFQADPKRATINLAMSVVEPLASTFSAWWMRDLTNAVVAQDSDKALFAAGLLGLGAFISILAGWTGFHLNMTLREKVGELMDRRVMELALAVPGLEHHERADYLDEIELLRTQRDQLSSSVQAVVMNIGMLARVGGTLALLGTVHPALALLPLFGIPSLLTAATAERRRQRTMEAIAEPLRVTRHLLELTTTAAPAKELRLFGLGPVLVGRHRALWQELDQIQDRTARRNALLSMTGWSVFGIGFVGALAIVAERAINGQASPGDVVLALTLASQVNSQVSGVVMMATWLISSLKTAGRYLWLVDYAHDAVQPHEAPAPAPDHLVHGIELEHVTFRYPATDVDVLRDVEPSHPGGRDRRGGRRQRRGQVDARETAVQVLRPDRRRDQRRRHRSAPHRSVGLAGSSVRRVPGLRPVRAAGARDRRRRPPRSSQRPRRDRRRARPRVGRRSDRVAARRHGRAARQVLRRWRRAVGWAMAEARPRSSDDAPGPVLLVLDEPTAALDAETEHALFERYAGAARRSAQARGAITVLVSHRFSTVRMADLIVVLDGAQVVEVGSHAELVAKNGLYAELFELQARAYR